MHRISRHWLDGQVSHFSTTVASSFPGNANRREVGDVSGAVIPMLTPYVYLAATFRK